MDIEVNWIAVGLATLSTMVVGSIWYSLSVFGKKWEKLARINRAKNAKKGDAVGPIITTLIVSAITAFVLAHMTYLANAYFQNSYLQDALSTAFWAWLGFTAARIITHDTFEGRPQALTLLTVSHELVTFMVMGLVIGLMGI